MMIVMPIGSLDLQLKHDLGEFFNKHQDCAYTAYDDHMTQDFVCEMNKEDMLLFVLQHPRYSNYVQTST